MFPFKPTIVSALVLIFISGFLLAQQSRLPNVNEMDWLELMLRQKVQNPFDPALEAKAARDEFARKMNAVQYAMNDVVYDFNANVRNDQRFDTADKAIDAMRKDPGWGGKKAKKR